ncbi:MAG: amidohydrolase family protein [Acidobacteria bacterium]|nr:amidohydrolase family protein [Acidobacteriota bacterium]
MKTHWGEVEVCDAHAHLFSRPFFRALAGGKEPDALGEKLGWQIPGEDATELAGRWVEELDRHGLKRSVLIASAAGDEGSVADAVRAYPQRLIGYFMLHPLVDHAVERAGRAIERLGLKGICLFPAMHKFSVQNEQLHPIYELAAGRAVVFVHMGVLSVGVRKKLGLPSLFDMRFSNPIDLHRVALEFPNVNFVIPHFGAGYFRETLMVGDLCPNVHVDTSSSNLWIRYVPGLGGLEEVFARALEVFGPKRILFGSDSSFFPRGWNAEILEKQAGVLERLGVSAGDAAAILGGNLERLVG